MMKKIGYISFLTVLVWGVFYTSSYVQADEPVDSTVPTSGYNNPLSIDAFDLKTLSGTSVTTNLSPNQQYHTEITISDADTVADVQSLAMVLHYVESTPDASFSAAMSTNTTLDTGNFVIFNWERTNTSGAALSDFTIDFNGTQAVSHSGLEWEVIQSTTPAISDASGNTEVSTSYTFELIFKVSKVARVSNNHRWHVGAHIIDGMIDNGSGLVTTTHSALSISSSEPTVPPNNGLNMDWYGEIEIASGETVDWVDANPIQPFTNALTTFSGINYISNGFFDYDVFPSDIWDAGSTLPTGVTYAALVEKEVFELTNQTQELAIKVADENNLAGSVLLKPSRQSNPQEMRIGSEIRTLEAGTSKTIHFWVALSEIFQNANYSGSLTFSIHNNIRPIRDVLTNETYATLSDAEAAGVTHAQILKPHTESVTLNAPMNLDFNGFTLTGDLSIDTAQSGSITLSAVGSIDGNLTIDAPNLTVNNQVDVSGTTTIDAIATTSYISDATHTGGIFIQGPGRIALSGDAEGASLTVNAPEAIALDGQIHSLLITGASANLTVNGTVDSLRNGVTGASVTIDGTVRHLLVDSDMTITLNGTLTAVDAKATLALTRQSGSTLGVLESSGDGRFVITGETASLNVPISDLKAQGEMISFSAAITPTAVSFNGENVLASIVSNAGVYQFTPSSMSQANTLVVEATNYQTLNQSFTPNVFNTNQEHGFNDFNAAIAAANPGDTLLIEATSHQLLEPITIDKSLILEGDIQNPDTVILNAPITGTDRDVIQVIANHVTIQGLTIQGAYDLDSNQDSKNAGILLGGDPYLLVSEPSDATQYSFGWWAKAVSHVAIRYNRITDNSYGIFAFHTQDLLIEHNAIFANTYNGDETTMWNGKGIQIYSSQDMADPSLVQGSSQGLQVTHDVLIQFNTIYDNDLFGIELNHAESYNGGDVGPMDVNVRIISNDIYNNGSANNYPWDSSKDIYRGISANGNERNVIVSNNAIYGHLTSTGDAFTDSSAGVRIARSQDWTLDNNIIEDNTRGIYAYATSSGINVEAGNVIRDNAQGIVFENSSTGTVSSSVTYARNTLTRYIPKGLNPEDFIILE